MEWTMQKIWEAIRTRFGGNANSKKMQKAVLKQQFEAFTISSLEGASKCYFCIHTARAATTKVICHTGAYSKLLPSTSSNNFPEREALASFADEVIYSLFVKHQKDLDLLP
ncbi:hypothetical protein Tco_1123922 [Tanacetum coccineum]|uniref:Uncharacterized protein n=1 Tax=Tanacetum coccineum TaxID=301880 RepID=A0ABQ5J4Q3_9ASTR